MGRESWMASTTKAEAKLRRVGIREEGDGGERARKR